jgi:flavorubredoxin
MDWLNVAKIAEGVHWVGVRDWNRKLFDALISLPRGTTYNSYLVVGRDRKALVDTVNPGFEGDLEAKIRRIVDPGTLDYVIMNHAEPDHAGAIPHMMSLNSKAMLITTKAGVKMARDYYGIPADRIKAVSDQETIDLGGMSLRFIEAPMLHWPETMFTYLQEDGVLFTCDFFGSHLAKGLYDDETEDLLVHAQRYFGEIMMPFRSMAERALAKIKDLKIDIIAPSHGPVHRNTRRIIEAYGRWARGETKRKATVVYVTMWKSTEKMIEPIVETLTSEGIEVSVHNLTVADMGEIARDLVDSRAIVLGAPTVLGGVHPLAQHATYLVKALRPPLRYGVILSSYGWSKGALRHIQEILGPSKLDVVGAMELFGPPSEQDVERIIGLGRTLADKIKAEG